METNESTFDEFVIDLDGEFNASRAVINDTMQYTGISEIAELLEGCEIEAWVTADSIQLAINKLAESLQFESWLKE